MSAARWPIRSWGARSAGGKGGCGPGYPPQDPRREPAHALRRRLGPMEIRRLRPNEWPALRALRLRAIAADPDAFGETIAVAEAFPDDVWRQRADDSAAPIFVADGATGLVGMVIGAPAPDERPAAALFSMWVAPEARGQGAGSALIDAVVDWARAAGYPAIGLGVTTTNASAIALYARKGFADIGERYPLRDDSDLVIQIMGMPL